MFDVGCGDGYVTRLVAAQLKTGSVLGVDASPRMVEAARSAPIPEGSRVSFEIGNALQLGLDRQFDLVFSFNVLHWIVDQRAVLAQLAAATRSTGHVVVQYVCGGPRPSLERVAMQVCAEPRWAGTFHGFHAPFIHVDPNSYANLVAAAGLRIQRFRGQRRRVGLRLSGGLCAMVHRGVRGLDSPARTGRCACVG